MNKKIISLFLLIYILLGSTVSSAPVGWRFCTYQQAKMAVKITDDINIQDKQGKTPLIWAATYNEDCRVTKLLLNEGAKVNIKDDKGLSALIHAVKNENDLCIVKELLDSGAEVNYQSPKGNTALHWAAKNKNLTLARSLVEAKADIHLANDNGQTALEISKELANSKLKNILLQREESKNDKEKSKPRKEIEEEIINKREENNDLENNTVPKTEDARIQPPQKNNNSQENSLSLYSGINYNFYSIANDNLRFESSAQGMGVYTGANYYLNENTSVGIESEYLHNISENSASSISISNLYTVLNYHFFFLGIGANYPWGIDEQELGFSLKTGLKLKEEINDRLSFNTSLLYRRLSNEFNSLDIDLNSYGLQGEFEYKF